MPLRAGSLPKRPVKYKDSNIKNDIPILTHHHPLGIKPWGNYLIDRVDDLTFNQHVRQDGLGAFAILSDELILEILGFVSASELLVLSGTSKPFYAFTCHDELWKNLTITELWENFEWVGPTWRANYLHRLNKSSKAYTTQSKIQVKHFYSDTLFQPFFCANTTMTPFLGKETIPRRSKLTLEEFRNEYEFPNLPVIITDIVPTWPAFRSWDFSSLNDLYGTTSFRAESISLPLSTYLNYASNTIDESPLYLFDKNFVSKCPIMGSDYTVPIYFSTDYFSVLGEETRPDYRWLIIGPSRSGSTFHQDPNGTSAWNAVIRGAKKWIMYPPGTTPPGVYTNSDQSEVTSPVSIMEWFLNFYSLAKQDPQYRPVEGVCKEGEIMFVPAGWWHLVINLEDSIAVTQNFVSDGNLTRVIQFLDEKKAQISGLPEDKRDGLGKKFKDALEKTYPGLLEQVEKEEWARERVGGMGTHSKKRKIGTFWDQIKHGKDNDEKSIDNDSKEFSFGFNFVINEDDKEFDGYD